MYKLVFIFITAILFCTTLCVGVIQPPMHKSFFIYDSEYKIVENKPEVQKVTRLPEKVNTPAEQKTVKTVKETVAPVTKRLEPVKRQAFEQTRQNPVQKVVEEVKTIPQTPIQITEEEKAQQEIIQWNIWRSNLQNQIMQDVKLPIIQQGTIFKFSFDVDKYGRISNVQTWSLTPSYTPCAIQYIAPVIRGYQGHSILNFPAGSNRISTTVEGGWKISKTSKYSTPKDYSDTEKVIKD